MRILTVTHFFEDHGGGIERVAGHLNRKFVELGAFAVWAASDADNAPDCVIEAVPLACFNPTEQVTGLPMPVPGLRAIRTLSREVRRSDAVVIHDALYFTSILALLIAKAQRKPTILIQHIASIPFSSAILRLVMKVANFLVTRPMLWAADARVFISNTVREELLGTPPRLPSELLFNGVDGTIFHPGAKAIPNALSCVDAANYKRRIVFVGRYVEKKGLAVLQSLAKMRPDLIFVLAGSGPERPREWCITNVHDIGPQKPEDLADLYRWADLLILPSVGEGFPLVIQEAMACGLPVICGIPAHRADPNAAQWLRGVPIDLSSPEVSAQRCADLIDDFELTLGESAEMARYALSRYDWQDMARRLISIAQSG